jgi:hypothetical protein
VLLPELPLVAVFGELVEELVVVVVGMGIQKVGIFALFLFSLQTVTEDTLLSYFVPVFLQYTVAVYYSLHIQ